jgi:sterol desaturase/sphingolipid hydroxylase (fatty acid hydroxylase superfamily)
MNTGLIEFLTWAHQHFSFDAIKAGWYPILCFYGLMLPFELLFPAQPGQRYRNLWRNFYTSLLFLTVGAVTARISHQLLGIADIKPLIDLNQYVPYALVPVIVIMTNDFFYYWFHRLQHAVPFLWQFHAVHHSDEEMNVTTSLRHHWIEDPLRVVLAILPMTLLYKLENHEVYFLALLLGNWGYFVHANVRIDFGRMTAWLSGPMLHRVHHSIEERHRDKNFAAYVPLWDVLFGTYFRPDGYPRTGVAPATSSSGSRAASAASIGETSRAAG